MRVGVKIFVERSTICILEFGLVIVDRELWERGPFGSDVWVEMTKGGAVVVQASGLGRTTADLSTSVEMTKGGAVVVRTYGLGRTTADLSTSVEMT
jgi:hypothetical protein